MDDADPQEQLSLVEQQAHELSAAPFFPEIEEAVERGEITHKCYTAERLFLQKPEKFKAIVYWLAQPKPLGLIRISKLVGVHHMTVSAVRDRFAKSVDIEKARLAELCKTGAELCLERIIEEAPNLPANTLGLTAAQLIDKFQLLTGGATSRIEDGRKPGVLTHEEFAALMKNLPEANAHVMESGMGLGGEEIPANGGGAADGSGGSAAAGEPARPGAQRGESDVQSLGSLCADADATADATGLTAAEGGSPAALPLPPIPPRGGGGLDDPPPPKEGLG